jgi:hypothetical protein
MLEILPLSISSLSGEKAGRATVSLVKLHGHRPGLPGKEISF